MNKTVWINGALAALVLAGCSRGTDTPDAVETPVVTADATYETFMSIADARLTDADATEADLTDLTAALPDGMSLRWESQSFDAASGATVFDGLTMALGGELEFGVTFEQASVWGLETDLLAARLSGQRLDETGLLFTRLEGTNMSYFGLAQAIDAVLDPIFSGIEGDLPEGAELAFDRVDSTTERVVLTDVSLRPWELMPLSPEVLSGLDEDIPAEILDYIHLAQQLVAVSRSVAMDNYIALGTVGTVEMRQPGANLTASYEVGVPGR